MGSKYLGKVFDIHGGGMDLIFPHHEAEIAQSIAAHGHQPVKYWLHNNMVTINGQKMGKSLGNFITLNEIFAGNHPQLEKAYSPMIIRFFILQAHYRSTLDFSNDALQAAEKALKRLLEAYHQIDKIPAAETSSVNIHEIRQACFDGMNDDFNSSIVLANLFEAVKMINNTLIGTETLTQDDIGLLKKTFDDFLFEILGLANESSSDNSNLVNELINFLLELREEARNRKDWSTSDRIRNRLLKMGIEVKDTKDGPIWKIL